RGLQRSSERKVNGTPTAAACSPHPNPLPKGEREPTVPVFFVGDPFSEAASQKIKATMKLNKNKRLTATPVSG
ncbi:hypothetical protein MXM41_15800, partial [Leclercia adecarboxylata]|uniref:hypothetical protein n=1 Tax=Leclercia adecarboxylata TaxID=83655 RepID=UPI002DBE5A9A